ncbi:hypothetical protein AAES_127361 [Amazona aestiva]|uniref:Calponin-homology (CH) domain-containing protein n=2 Tax=Neoaves TaxID=3078114 RepID=A0A0Q3M3I3_AMAAE|nr:hypothetical protein AAES_127361 [Amazona aestiva]
MKKDESFLGKLGGTLARKKKAKEVSDLQEEGKNAINAPMNPSTVDVHPEDTLLDRDLKCQRTNPQKACSRKENEERTMIDPNSKEDPKFKELIKVLIDWINDVLVEERIIVKQLEEDLYDGQVLQKLLEKLADRKLNVAEVTQSEIGQKQKLQTVLEAVHDLLRPHGWTIKWNVDSIHGKNLISILHLLVALAMHFRAPIRLPEHVSVQVVVVRCSVPSLKLHAGSVTDLFKWILFSRYYTNDKQKNGDEVNIVPYPKRDAFDTLFDHAPDKLSVVKKSLITFVNKHLNKLNLEVTELETQDHINDCRIWLDFRAAYLLDQSGVLQSSCYGYGLMFADGVYLVLLMGLLEDYFVPLHNFYLTPESFDQKVHNVSFAFELMQDGGLKKPKARPEGEKKKFIKPTSGNNPKLEELKLLLIDWINTTLKEEHIVVKSLEEDLYDGLVLHHLLAILTKDLVSTLHLLVAIAKHFKPNLAMPPNVQVETITIENTSRGLKTANAVEYITENKENLEAHSKDDAFDELFSRAPDKLDAVKKVLLHFVNQHVGKLGLNVKDISSQFADGVILLLLIGQLEGYFLNLKHFFLTPASSMEMLHNVNLALDLLADGGLLNFSVNSEACHGQIFGFPALFATVHVHALVSDTCCINIVYAISGPRTPEPEKSPIGAFVVIRVSKTSVGMALWQGNIQDIEEI